MRYRRLAQCRQIHAVQRAHQGRNRGGELPLLHHRAQRRHRRGARCAAGATGRYRQAAKNHSCGGRVRRHRRAGCRRIQGRGPGKQVPRQHPRNRRHRACGALFRRRQRGARRRQDRSAERYRDHQHRTRAGRSGDGGKDHGALRQGREVGRQGSAAHHRGAGKGAAGAESSQACAQPGAFARGAAGAAAAVPDDGQAGNVCRQRRRKRLQRQPAARARAGIRQGGGCAGGRDLRRHRGANGGPRATRKRRSFSPTWAWTSRAWTA